MSKRKWKRWTENDIELLESYWGMSSMIAIARKLKRTPLAVQLKAQRLKLGDARTHIDGITISQLSQVFDTHYGIVRNWRDKYGLPVKSKVVANYKPVQYVTYKEFWKWADENRQMLDFARIPKLAIGPEPDWVAEKRKADELRKINKPMPHNTPWSDGDDKKLKWMLEQFKYTYPEISQELQRSQGAVKRRMLDLDIKLRPIHLNNHNKYSQEEVNTLIDMMETGYRFEEIAAELGNGRSALGLRGKAERMGYKFKNGVPYKEGVL